MANNLLQGKKGIVFGALNDQSIAWKTALHAHAQGAELVLTNAPVAMRMGEIHQLAAAVGGARGVVGGAGGEHPEECQQERADSHAPEHSPQSRPQQVKG